MASALIDIRAALSESAVEIKRSLRREGIGDTDLCWGSFAACTNFGTGAAATAVISPVDGRDDGESLGPTDFPWLGAVVTRPGGWKGSPGLDGDVFSLFFVSPFPLMGSGTVEAALVCNGRAGVAVLLLAEVTMTILLGDNPSPGGGTMPKAMRWICGHQGHFGIGTRPREHCMEGRPHGPGGSICSFRGLWPHAHVHVNPFWQQPIMVPQLIRHALGLAMEQEHGRGPTFNCPRPRARLEPKTCLQKMCHKLTKMGW